MIVIQVLSTWKIPSTCSAFYAVDEKMEEEKDVHITDPFHWIHRKDQTITLFEWDGLESVLVIIYTLIMGIKNIVCKVLIINYILRYAPKDRPINNMMLVEQVKKFPATFMFPFSTIFFFFP